MDRVFDMLVACSSLLFLVLIIFGAELPTRDRYGAELPTRDRYELLPWSLALQFEVEFEFESIAGSYIGYNLPKFVEGHNCGSETKARRHT
jgi:hypothetical protein